MRSRDCSAVTHDFGQRGSFLVQTLGIKLANEMIQSNHYEASFD